MSEKRLKSLDLSKHMITHMNKELTSGSGDVEHVNLDQNSISKLENISHLHNLQQLSAGHNCLIKISGLNGLRNLTVLNLPENSICSIEGISHLNQLIWLNLSGNNIRHITGLENNLALRHLDLSDNTVTSLADLSYLYALKALLLHGNIIRDLKDAPKYLPKNVSILSLAENEITELSQVRNLVQLKKLEQLSIMNNPCVTYQQLTHHSNSYRAYVLSWTCNLEVLDGQHVSLAERQNAGQLLTEGVAHTFSYGDQGKLINYLSHVSFTSSTGTEQRINSNNYGDGERPVTAGGGERTTPVKSSGPSIKKARSDERLYQPDSSPAATLSSQGRDGGHGVEPSSKLTKGSARQSNLESSPTSGSPLVSRKDMKGLIRQVIGQERSPNTGGNLRTAPKQSAALPKMSRSRSASQSPSREKKTPASRKLILVSSTDYSDQSGAFITEPEVPFSSNATKQSKEIKSLPADHKRGNRNISSSEKDNQAISFSKNDEHQLHAATAAFTARHETAAVIIQSLWRGYRTRNLDSRVLSIKQELRSRRLEETLAFVITEMNRQHNINSEGQKIRSTLIAGIEQLAQKVEELQTSIYPDPSAV